MTCEDLLEVLHDYIGGEIVVEQRTTVEVHVSSCAKCGILVETYRHTVRLARALPKCDTLPAALEAKLRALLEPELKRDAE